MKPLLVEMARLLGIQNKIKVIFSEALIIASSNPYAALLSFHTFPGAMLASFGGITKTSLVICSVWRKARVISAHLMVQPFVIAKVNISLRTILFTVGESVGIRCLFRSLSPLMVSLALRTIVPSGSSFSTMTHCVPIRFPPCGFLTSSYTS